MLVTVSVNHDSHYDNHQNNRLLETYQIHHKKKEIMLECSTKNF